MPKSKEPNDSIDGQRKASEEEVRLVEYRQGQASEEEVAEVEHEIGEGEQTEQADVDESEVSEVERDLEDSTPNAGV